MLHSTLPRAFLPPGIGCLGYYGEEVQRPYATTATWHIPMTETYVHGHLPSWESPRSVTPPCPLDLSLKPPQTPDEEPIEVDDNEDRHRAGYRRYHQDDEDDEDHLVVDDLDSPIRSSPRSTQSYESSFVRKELAISEPVDKTRILYPVTETPHKYYLHSQKIASSPPQTSVQSYHQQLLLTPPYNNVQRVHAPMTPPSTPSPPQCPQRRPREEDPSPSVTPKQQQPPPEKRPKKKHARRLKFDEDTSSPVSGTVILGPDEAVVTGDIDPAFNIVEVTDEARAELAKIENRLGPYQCKLCRQLHDDAFQLAQHRCSRIAHVEYRCPECDKRFSCPANLASHRRWHKPRLPAGDSNATSVEIPCTRCDAKFTRQAALRKHLATQHPETNNNNSNNNNNNNNGEQTRKPEMVQPGGTSPIGTELP